MSIENTISYIVLQIFLQVSAVCEALLVGCLTFIEICSTDACSACLRFLFQYIIAMANPSMALIIEESIVQVTIVAIIAVESSSCTPVERINRRIQMAKQL